MTNIPVTFTCPSSDPEHRETQKERISLFHVLCCFKQALIGSFLFPLSFNPNSKTVVTSRR